MSARTWLSALRFMESPLPLLRTHWDHEPFAIALFISNELHVRFMESPLGLATVPRDPEPL